MIGVPNRLYSYSIYHPVNIFIENSYTLFHTCKFKRDIQLLSGSFESVPNWLNWGC